MKNHPMMWRVLPLAVTLFAALTLTFAPVLAPDFTHAPAFADNDDDHHDKDRHRDKRRHRERRDKGRDKERGFSQAGSAAGLEAARGIVHDVNIDGPWVISGEWILDCDDACADADLDDIAFDMAHVMVTPLGDSSHSHTYIGYSATSVTVDGDTLTIEGRITGSGEIGPSDITLELAGLASGNATFFFELVEDSDPHLIGRIGGVIVESDHCCHRCPCRMCSCRVDR